MTVAAGVLTFGVQQLTAGETYTGGVGILVGLGIFTGYQYAEELDHNKQYDDLVEMVGQDTFQRLSEMGAEQLEDMMDREEASK